MTSPVDVEVSDLHKRYRGQPVLCGLSFSVAPGEIFGMVGPNGAGKTTTLEIIEGLRQPDRGRVTVLGLDPARDWSALALRVGIQLQAPALYDKVTVREAVDLFASFYPRALPAREVLRRFQLEDHERRYFAHLSGGLRRRLSLALALIHDPQVLFLDEPSTGLDPHARHRLWDDLRALSGRGKTVLLATHYMEEAEGLCGRVAMIDRGRLVACGRPADLVTALGVNRKLRFRVEGRGDLSWLNALAGVGWLEKAGNEVWVYTRDGAVSPDRLAQEGQRRGLALQLASAQTLTLEDAYLAMTRPGAAA